MKNYLLKLLKTIAIQIIALTILIGTVTFAAISWPTNVPVGEIAGGKFIEYFANIEGDCPDGKVLRGFNKDFTKNCVDSFESNVNWNDREKYFTLGGTLITYSRTAVGLPIVKKVWGCDGTYSGGQSRTDGPLNAINYKKYCLNDTDTDTASNYCANLDLGGKTDWHLPSRLELTKLFYYKNEIKDLNGHYFWSSTEQSKTQANAVGSYRSYSNADKSSSYEVICVRGEHSYNAN